MPVMYEERTITVQLTPKKLRALADRMERVFPKKMIGDSTVIDVWSSRDFTIRICGDQEAFNRFKNSGSDWV